MVQEAKPSLNRINLYKMINIVSDFEEELFLYRLPSQAIKVVSDKSIPVKITMLSKVGAKMDPGKVEIYWGHKPFLDVIAKFPGLRWIHLGTSGYEKLDLDYCRNRSIRVSISNEQNASSVALTAIAFLLSDLRGISFPTTYAVENSLSKEEMRRLWEMKNRNADNSNLKKILILGHGAVGSLVQKYLIDMNFYALAINSSSIFFPDGGFFKYVDKRELASLVKTVDYVINCLPINDKTKNFVDTEFLHWLPVGSGYISVGRASTTDESALLERVERDKIRFVAVDVFDSIKHPSFRSLVEKGRLVFLPHVAGFHKSYWDEQVRLFADNLSIYLSSGRLKGEVL